MDTLLAMQKPSGDKIGVSLDSSFFRVPLTNKLVFVRDSNPRSVKVVKYTHVSIQIEHGSYKGCYGLGYKEKAKAPTKNKKKANSYNQGA